MVQAFCPTEKHNGVYSYRPGTLQDGVVSGAKVLSHAKPYSTIMNAKIFPLIIFIPGLGGERQKYTILCEELASYGYIVISLDQPYVSNYVQFTDGTKVVLAFKDAWKVPKDRDYRYKYYNEAMAAAIKDIEYMLSSIDNISSKELNGVIDKENIILMGHSFGGNIAHTLGFQDERVKAVIDIDSKITERQIYGRIGIPPNPLGKPVLFIRGMMQYQEEVGDQLSKITNSTIWEPNVEHSAFSDNAYFAAKIPNFGKLSFISDFSNWFFKKGPHFSNIDTNIGGKDIDDWYSEYCSTIVKWLKINL
jgi:pimeloyl-ACP methyl ester carboxylesterase